MSYFTIRSLEWIVEFQVVTTFLKPLLEYQPASSLLYCWRVSPPGCLPPDMKQNQICFYVVSHMSSRAILF
jgi:hypothetical protein